jgi:hypothetical protein
VLEQHGLPCLDAYSSSGFTPILAIGSNASPEQLARKYTLDMFPAGVVIPVSHAAALLPCPLPQCAIMPGALQLLQQRSLP